MTGTEIFSRRGLRAGSGRCYLWVVARRASLSTPAIVLRTVDFGESDRIVTVLSRDFGKFTGIAKGAKRSRRRFSGALEIFARIRLDFQRRRDSQMAFLERAVVRAPWPALVQSIPRYTAAVHVIEVADKISVEHEVGDDLFQAIDAALDCLGQADPGRFVLRLFELSVLAAGGWRPRFDVCVVCGRAPAAPGHAASLDVDGGGVRCARCARDGGLRLHPETLGCLQLLEAASRNHRAPRFEVEGEIEAWLECRREAGPGAPASRSRALPRVDQELRTALVLMLGPHLRSPLRALEVLPHLRAPGEGIGKNLGNGSEASFAEQSVEATGEVAAADRVEAAHMEWGPGQLG